MSMLGKARSRPDQVAKVMQSVATNGVPATYRKVMGKLDSYTPLGYSLCGVVEQVGAGIDDVKVGDLVACAYNEHALHAEVNWVPKNLYAPVPEGLAPRHAAFGTVGSIAMQGVRQGEPQLGEVALVIGLGLIGQLLVQLLTAAGVRVVGADPDPTRCELAERLGAAACGDPASAAVEAAVAELTDGHGVDQVFLARRRRQQPARRTGRPARPGPRPGRRHRQVPPGPALERVLREGTRRPLLALLRPRTLRPVVRAGGPRLPDRLRPLDRAPQPGLLPRPGGPRQGRRGAPGLPHRRLRRRRRDVPAPEGRRTQGRGRAVPLPRADGGSGETLTPVVAVPAVRRGEGTSTPARSAKNPVRLAFVGAGNYATSMLLPHLARREGVELSTVVTTTALSGANAQRKFGFAQATTDLDAVLGDKSVDAVFVVTRHSSHAELTRQALLAKQDRVRGEAPRPHRGRTGRSARGGGGVRQRPPPGGLQPPLRTAAPGGQGPVRRPDRTGEPALPRQRGQAAARQLVPPTGRRGLAVRRREGGHFIDTASWLLDADPVSVYTTAAPGNEDLQVVLRYPDGSTATISYVTTGAPGFPRRPWTWSRTARCCVSTTSCAPPSTAARSGSVRGCPRPGTRDRTPNWPRSSRRFGPVDRCRCRWNRWSPPRRPPSPWGPAW